VIARELEILQKAVLTGLLLGVTYELFRLIRLLGFKKQGMVIIQDLLFLGFFLMITFLFFVEYTNGIFRSYVIAGECLGFLFYYFTIGKLLFFLFARAALSVKKVALQIKRKVIIPTATRIGKTLHGIFSKTMLFLQNSKN